MTELIEFEGIIEEAGRGGACIAVPFDPKAVFGSGRSLRVVATYDGYEASSNVMSMGGRHVLGVHKATRSAIGKGPGDTVAVTLRPDTAPRVVEVPAELAQAFASSPDAQKVYESLAFTTRKEFARWVSEAKRQETRDRRATRAVEMIIKGERL